MSGPSFARATGTALRRLPIRFGQVRQRRGDAWAASVVDASGVGLVRLDLEHRVVRANAAFAQLVGRSPEALTGCFAPSLFHPDSPAADLGGAADVLSGQRSRLRAQRLLTGPGGRAVPVQVDLAAVRERGRVVGFAVAVTDQGEQLGVQEELRAARERADALFDRSPVGLLEVGPDLRVRRGNAALHRMLGYPPGELAGIDPLTLHVHRDVGEDALGRLSAGAEYAEERRLRRRDGSEVDALVVTAALRDEAGRPDGFAAFLVDLSDQVAQREAVEERQRLLDTVLSTVDVGILVALHSGEVLRNPAHRRFYGFTDSESELPVEAPAAQVDVFTEDGRALPVESWPIARALHGEVVGVEPLRVGPRGGPHTPVLARTSLITDDAGEVLGAVLALTDVSGVREAEVRAVAAQRRLEAILAATPDYVYVRDLPSERLTFQNGAAIAGHPPERHRALSLARRYETVHPDDLPALFAADEQVRGVADGAFVAVAYRLRGADDRWHWMRRNTTPFARDPATGAVVEILGVVRDVTDIVESEQRLVYAATHDPLTGLPNRASLPDRLGGALARAARGGAVVGVLFCDLDGFKAVNDSAGHEAGDAVLAEVAHRMRAVLREGSWLARVGGDEFVIVEEGLSRDAEAARLSLAALADRVVTAVRASSSEHRVSVSVGAAIGAHGDTAAGLLSTADAAMYDAKRAGKNRAIVLPRQRGSERETARDPDRA